MQIVAFIVPVFGRFSWKCFTYSFNGAWLPCSYRPVSVTRTCSISVNVKILRVNVTLFWCRGVLNLLFWAIFPYMATVKNKQLILHMNQ